MNKTLHLVSLYESMFIFLQNILFEVKRTSFTILFTVSLTKKWRNILVFSQLNAVHSKIVISAHNMFKAIVFV